jgi:hypothetical protein
VVSTITILGPRGGDRRRRLRGRRRSAELTVVIFYRRGYGPSAIAHTTGQLQGALAGTKRPNAR